MDLPHDNCHEDCPVAIKNQKDIETLFLRVDEVREEVKGTVRWKHFMWIVGGLVAVFFTVNTILYDAHNRSMKGVFEQTKEMQKQVILNMNRLDVLMTRMDSFMVLRSDNINHHKEDHERLEVILKALHDDIRVINRSLGQRPAGP